MGFSYPQGLFGLGFLAVLVWIYLRERRQRELEVPSLLLWRSIAEERRRTRFQADPLFLLRMMLLAALAFGMARPYLDRGGTSTEIRRAVLVIDTSASMQTIERGERRLDHVRRKAREAIAALDAAEEVMVIAVEARPRVVLAFTRDRAELSRVLAALEPGDGPSRIALGIQLARSSRKSGEGRLDILVFTDLPRAELSAPLAAGERLQYFRVGRTDDNVAVAALRVYQSPFQESGEARAYALVQNYSSAAKDVELRAMLDAREVVRERLTLAPRDGRAVPIRELVGPGRLEARLQVADALELDNHAIAFVRPVRWLHLLAVGRNPDLFRDLRALAEAVPVFRVQAVTPEELKDEMFRTADVAIFDGFVPDAPLRTNALFVYPPPNNRLFTVEGEAVDASILDWDDHDPILSELRYVEALPLARARMMRLPGWARPLISSRAGADEFPLAFAGELDGRRVVCFAFSLAEHSVRESENLSLLLLVLNAIRWLTPPDPSQPIQIDIGERYRETLAEPTAVAVVDPSGSGRELAPRTELAVDIERSGEYRLEIGRERRTIYANLFDPEESDIGRAGPEGVETIESGEAPPRWSGVRSIREYGWWLYVAAMGLLLSEWLYSMRRRARTSG